MRKAMMLGVVCLALYPAMVAAATPEEGKTVKLAVKAKVEHKTKDTTHTKAKTQAKAVTAYKRPIAPLPMPASELALEQDQKMLAEQVHTGRMACELGNSVYESVDALAWALQAQLAAILGTGRQRDVEGLAIGQPQALLAP